MILLADDLAPSETVQLDKSKVLSFVTRHGSTNSHTAILARTMNIPALIGVDFPEDVDGKMGIVDGYEGKIIIDPPVSVMEAYQKKKAEDEEKKRLLQELKGKENITKDGTKINLYANIGSVGDVASVLANDAGGIGLFRSEFLYLESRDYPTEEEQFAAYRKVAEAMAGKKSSSVHLISVRTSRWIISASTKKIIRQWVTVRSVSALTAARYSRHSFVHCIGQAITEPSPSCSR